MDRSSITDDEFFKLSSCIKYKCKVLGVAHACLYLYAVNIWKYVDNGLAVLIKDNERKNYYLQFFKEETYKLLCEFEILWNCKYEKSPNNLYTFSGEKDMLHLTFDDTEEASKFEEIIQEIIRHRIARNFKRSDDLPAEILKRGIASSLLQNNKLKVHSMTPKSHSKNNNAKSNISKNEISTPSNFQHLDHLGLDGYFFESPNMELYNYFIDLTKNQTKLVKTTNPENLINRIAPSIPKPPKHNPPQPPLRQQFSQPVLNSQKVTDIPNQSNSSEGYKSSLPQSLSSSSMSMSPLSSESKSSKGKSSNTDLSESSVGIHTNISKTDLKKLESSQQDISECPPKDSSYHGDTRKDFLLTALAAYFIDIYNIKEASSDSDSNSEDAL